MMPLVFSYKIDDLLEEITKRTSYLGKMRGTEQEPFLLNRLSLTSGEDFMFSEFLDNAVNDTYEWVKGFGRNINYYDKVLLTYKDIPMYKDCGAVSTIDGMPIALNVRNQVSISSVETTETNITVTHAPIIVKPMMGDIRTTVHYKFKITTILDDTIEQTEVIEETDTQVILGGGSYRNNIQFVRFDFIEDGCLHVLKDIKLEVDVDIVPKEVTNISKGTYVEYRSDFNDDSVFDVYQVTGDCTSADWMEHAVKLDYDPRGSVTYILERKENFDEHAVPSIHRALKEAMVNHIIYQWFEYVNAPEAERFYLKYDEAGQKAQVGMNARTKDVQRKYKLF
jgi:hypothetical protein